jgi:hypothetical protein
MIKVERGLEGTGIRDQNGKYTGIVFTTTPERTELYVSNKCVAYLTGFVLTIAAAAFGAVTPAYAASIDFIEWALRLKSL